MKNSFIDIKNKIVKGLEISFEKLLESKKKNNGTLIFSIDNKIIKVKPK